MSESHYELISFELCPYVQRAAIVLLEKNIPFTRTNIELNNKPDWFLKISPLGKVPVLKFDNEVLFESMVIAEYLDEVTEPPMHDKNPVIKAKHRAWIEFASTLLHDIYLLRSVSDKADFSERKEIINYKLDRVDSILDDNGPFFSGESFLLVDAGFAPVFRYLDILSELHDFGFYKSQKLKSYAQALAAKPSVQQSVSETYHEKVMQRLHEMGGYITDLVEAASNPS